MHKRGHGCDDPFVEADRLAKQDVINRLQKELEKKDDDIIEARRLAQHYARALDEANDALLEHGIEMRYSELPLSGIMPWQDPWKEK